MKERKQVTIIHLYDSEDDLVGIHAAETFSEAEEMSDLLMEAHEDVAAIRVITVELGKVFNERTLH